MAHYNRGIFFKVVLFLFLLILFVLCALAIWATATGTARDSYTREINNAHYASDLNKNLKEKCVNSEISLLLKCVSEIVDITRENQRDEDNSQSQKNMDRWAFFALILSYISIPINIFGIIFIFCNLVEARKMTNAAIKSSEVGDKTLIEAQKSTKFSEQSVKLAREALFATNRPWIQINCTPASNLIFAEDIIKLEIDVELANIGTAPACNIVIPVRELCPDASIAKEKMHEETKKFKGISKNLLRIVIGEDGFSIFPEQKRSFKFEFNLDKKDFLIRIDELNKIEFEGAEKYYGRSKLAIVLGVLYVIPGDTVDRFTFVSFDIVEKYLSFIGFDASEKIIKNSDIDLICSKAGSYIN